MSQKRLSVSAASLLLAVGCIGPQGAQPCAETPASDGQSADAGGEETLIEAVVPTGTLIWDGGSISNIGESLAPPGRWFVPAGVSGPAPRPWPRSAASAPVGS